MTAGSPISEARLFHVVLPPRRAHKWTGSVDPIGGYVLVKLIDRDGHAGWGEAPVLKEWGGDYGRYFGESPATTLEVVQRFLAPAVAGCAPVDIAEVHQRMDRALKGFPYAKAAMETACYDLAGRQHGLPVHRLLGGAVRRRIPIAHSIGLMQFEDAEREVAKVVAEGIRAIKIKVGAGADRDVEMVRRVREAAGPAVDLCIDANQGYATPGEAIQAFRRMDAARIRYFEQPVQGIARLAQVARAIDAPVMADESAWTAHDVIEIAERRAAQIISIYVTKPGGLYRAMQVAATAQAAGLVCNVNGSVETGVGNLANLQLAAAAEAVTLPSVIPVSTPEEHQSGQVAGIYYKDDLLVEPMRFAEGSIVLPEAMGMGIAVDEQKVERYTVDQRVWRN